MKKRVVITGLGVTAPIGIGKDDFWNSLKMGKSGIEKITRFDTSGYPCQVAGEINDFDTANFFNSKTARRMDRFSQLSVACAQMAIEDAGIEIGNGALENAGVVVSSAMGGIPMAEDQHSLFLEKGLKRVSPYLAISIFSGAASSQISISLGIKGCGNTIGGGCTAGTDAVGYAFEIIRNGEVSMVLAGGAEAPLAPLTFGAFCVIHALSTINGNPARASRPFDAERNGFVMSEGAGIMVLEELEHALKRGAHIYAEVVGYATTHDSFNMVQPSPIAEGAAEAVKIGLKNAGILPDKIDYINAHGTSTQVNDKVETIMIKEVFGERAYSIPISATKSMIGHAIGASGAIEIIATILSIENQFLHPTINYEYPDPECDLDYVPNVGRPTEINFAISNSFGFGGKNSVLILKKFIH
jgi:3-oxoacyl-[acyl-carrier-protein] synthase II